MLHLTDDFCDGGQGGRDIVILPISRLELEDCFTIGRFHFYPADTINFEGLKIAKGPEITDFPVDTNVFLMKGESLRQVCSSLSAPSPETLFEMNAVVAFQPETTVYNKLRSTHEDDVALISSLSQEAERAMDHIRYNYCRFDLPETLPGVVGSWNDSHAYCCAVLFNSESGTSEMIAGEAVLHSVVSKGLGLELSSSQCVNIKSLPTHSDGEVGGIVQHALLLHSDAMNANTNTSKYLRVMTLFEFLASPFKYQQFKQSKKNIIAHIAGGQTEYDSLLERFKYFSDLKDAETDEQLGLRTLLTHHGHSLEEALPDKRQRATLFLELQGYAWTVIKDLLRRKNQGWKDITEYRKQRRSGFLEQAKTGKEIKKGISE